MYKQTPSSRERKKQEDASNKEQKPQEKQEETKTH
jgi:hypothetical protein